MAIPLKEFEKDPTAILDYTIDWSTWLAGDQIRTSTWAPATGITSATETVDSTRTKTTAWLSGGTVGSSYAVTNTITTCSSPSRTDDRSIVLIIRAQ